MHQNKQLLKVVIKYQILGGEYTFFVLLCYTWSIKSLKVFENVLSRLRCILFNIFFSIIKDHVHL